MKSRLAIRLVTLPTLLWACAPATPTVLPPWVLNPICELPCWGMITPGKTPYGNVISLLDEAGIQGRDWAGDAMTFNLGNTSGEFNRGDDGTVGATSLQIQREHLSLGILENALSQPDEIALLVEPRDPRKCLVSMLYRDIGVVLDAYLANHSANAGICEVIVDEAAEISAIIAVGTGVEESVYWLRALPESGSIRWRGYGAYP